MKEKFENADAKCRALEEELQRLRDHGATTVTGTAATATHTGTAATTTTTGTAATATTHGTVGTSRIADGGAAAWTSVTVATGTRTRGNRKRKKGISK